MINENTVLILGAGAGVPYGFPTGEKLKKDICALNTEMDGADAIFAELLQGSQPSDWEDFLTSFKISPVKSIDEWLARNPQYTAMGKLAIARILLEYEKRSNLNDPDIENDWYAQLYNRMDDGDFEKIRENNITIVTFNYDRSLEEFFANAMRHTYINSDPQKLADVVNDINIIHVHGSLGKYFFIPDKATMNNYGKTSLENVKRAVSSLSIVHEELSEALHLDDARKAIRDSNRVVFLGFSYDQRNLEKIGPVGDSNLPTSVRTDGTTYGMTTREVKLASRRIELAWKITADRIRLGANSIKEIANERMENMEILEYLRRSPYLE